MHKFLDQIRPLLTILALSSGATLTPLRTVQGQVVPDDTLGTERSQVSSETIRGLSSERIEGGATRGDNLFHSFQQFNIDLGRGVYFSNPVNVENIFSRVTGDTVSNLQGQLGVLGEADLFLMNPNGIVFGPNASLDLGGSFIATTSEAIAFDEQASFSTTNPVEPSGLLQINPTVFLFGASPGQIINQSTAPSSSLPSSSEGLSIAQGDNVIFAGGNVSFEGGRLTAPDGHVQIAAISSESSVPFDSQAMLLSLENISETVERDNISLVDNGVINVQGDAGGNIDLLARNINIQNRGRLTNQAFAGSNAGNQQPGIINIEATGQVLIEQQGRIANTIPANEIGDAGQVNLQADVLRINGLGSVITTSNFGEGNAGKITITTNKISIDQGELFSRIPSGRVGNAGAIEINADSVSLSEAFITTTNRGTGDGGDIILNLNDLTATNGATLTASVFGTGDSGNITINAQDSVQFDGFRIDSNGELLRTAAFTNVERGGNGQGGEIRLSADSISLTNGGALFSNIREGGRGRGGDIYVSGRTLNVSNAAELSANVLGQGIAGNIFIELTENAFFDGGDAFSNIGASSTDGKGGNIDIDVNALYLANSGQISTTAFGQGDAGNITIQAREQVNLDGAGENIFGTSILSATVGSGTSGRGGDISITTGSLTAQNGAQISTPASARGVAGNILINARDSVTFTGGRLIDRGRPSLVYKPSAALSQAQNQGLQGGNIVINATSLNVLNGAELNASNALGTEARAGDVIITLKDGLVVDGFGLNGSSSSISSASSILGLGAGGDIEITADTVQVSNGGVITSQTGAVGADGGDIFVNTRIFEAVNGGQLLTTTEGRSRAGNIMIDARERIEITGQDPNFEQRLQGEGSLDTEGSRSGLFASTLEQSFGNGGALTLRSPNVRLENNGIISAQSRGVGTAGSIILEGRDRIRLNDGEIITAADNADGGDIFINDPAQRNSGTLVLEGDSDITTNSQNDGGNITIGGSVVAFDDSDILARSQNTRGGNITLNALFSESLPPDNQPPFDGDGNVDINADGQLAAGTITTPDTSFVQNSLSELPEALINPETLVANSCVSQNQETNSDFTTTSRNPIKNPNAASSSSYSTGAINTTEATTSNSSNTAEVIGAIVEPEAIYQLSDGRLLMSRSCAESSGSR